MRRGRKSPPEFTSAGLTLRLRQWGDPELPALVCLHGVTSHAAHFARLADRLADRYSVLALDLRGHADSTWEPPWHLEQHVAHEGLGAGHVDHLAPPGHLPPVERGQRRDACPRRLRVG